MRRYDLVTFDFDGTLADSAAWFIEAMRDLAGVHGYKRVSDAEVAALRSMPSRQVMKALGIRFWQVPAIARQMRQRSLTDAASINLFPGIADVMSQLESAGVTVAVVSSNGEAAVRAVLGPAARHVREFRCSASIFGKARKIDSLRRQLGIPPSRVLHIGDETRDIDAAHKAGVAAGAVLYGYADAAPLLALQPELVFEVPADIARACLSSS
jgi:phosphoglycolate phosphatase